MALAGAGIGRGQAVGMVRPLGDANALLGDRASARELAQGAEAPGHPGPGSDRLQRRHAEALARARAHRPFQVALEALDRLVEPAEADVRLADAVVRDRLQGGVAERV